MQYIYVIYIWYGFAQLSSFFQNAPTLADFIPFSFEISEHTPDLMSNPNLGIIHLMYLPL